MPELKTRGPFAVWILSIVTFGIYYLVWFAKTTAEVKAVNPNGEKNVNSAPMVWSLLIGALTLFIWPIVNWFKFCASIRQEQEAAGLTPTFSTGLATLFVFLASTHVCYVQSQQNLVVAAVSAKRAAPAQPVAA
ncbi:hypothetical protein GCM10009853_079250 [Glycomyces scopariae]